MSHPFENLTSLQRRSLFLISLAASLFLITVMNLIGRPLMTEAAIFGIVSFEFAGDSERAFAIVDSWNQEARLTAAFSLGLDYLFIIAYSTAISLACLWTSDVTRNSNWPLDRLGSPLAWGQWAAGILDAFENLGLILILIYGFEKAWPELVYWSALIKFILVFLGLSYAFYGLVVYLIVQIGKTSER